MTERDIIDVASPGAQHLEEHAELCRAVIASRAPELAESDIRAAYGGEFAPQPELQITTESLGNESTYAEVFEHLVTALDEFGERLDGLEQAIRDGGTT